MKLEQAIQEIDKVYEFWKKTDLKQARKCCDDYINVIIDKYIPKDMRDFHRKYWSSLKEKEDLKNEN
jgi:hypothetical protein